jgi:arylsulfatase A-like enzyme
MISDLLAGAGYNCGYVGKWHMGNDQQPQHQFKYWYTMLGGSAPYQNPRMSRNGEVVQENGYLADLITANACRFLDAQQAGSPFFLTVSHFNPHVPYSGLPQKYYDMYAKTTFETIGWQPPAPNPLREKEMLKDTVGNIRRCAASVTSLDDQVGTLLAKIHERGLDENTLVLFAGDNGFLLGRHGLWSKSHASDPINMYEEVMQVPMLWRWIGHVPADNTRPELVSFYDLLPTLCDVTGVTAPAGRNLPGRSYWPLVTNQTLPRKNAWPVRAYGEFRNTWMCRDSRYKLVDRNDGKGPGELYDLRVDPRERVNQHGNPQFLTVRDRLAGDLAAWRKKYV